MTSDAAQAAPPDSDTFDQDARAQDIALALMGAGTLDPSHLAGDAVWERPGGAVAGRTMIIRALRRVTAPDRIAVDQVVTHGRSGSVSGRMWLAEDERLFCHVLRFSSAARRDIAQMVSFEHVVKG